MRRAAFAVLGTAIGTALLIGAKIGTPTSGTDTQVVAALDTDEEGAASGASTGPSPRASASGKADNEPKKEEKKAEEEQPPSGSGLRDGTFAGASANYQYGAIKVTVIVSGGKVSDVSATFPQDDPTTIGVNERAMPQLRQQVLAAQSAEINTVSGASLTSQAYRLSLQSALDKAKA